jgi:hypothetical protein
LIKKISICSRGSLPRSIAGQYFFKKKFSPLRIRRGT